jgi:dihydrofolate reductase
MPYDIGLGMRRIVMFNRVTVDGFFAGPDGSLDWVVPDKDLDRAGASGIPGTDTVLFGRRTYEMFAAFWPYALDDSPTSPNPHMPRQRSPEMRAMSTMLNEATKLVFSRTLKEVTWNNSRVLPTFDPREIEAMKRQPGKDMIVFGSGSIVSQLTKHGLIDEYQFVVDPVLLGKGKRLLGDLPTSTKLELKEAKAYPSGNVMLRYPRGVGV